MKFRLQFLFSFAICIGLSSPGLLAGEFQYLPETETVDLEPRMRPEPLSAALYLQDTAQIYTYLENVLIFNDMDQFETLPYIVGFDRNNNMGGPGDIAFTKGLNRKNDLSEYNFLEPGAVLVHPETQEELGLQAYVIGKASIQKFGDTQTVLITNARTSLHINTRMIPLTGIDLPGVLEVKYPPRKLDGYVLSIYDDRDLGGIYSSTVVSLGRRDGLKQGHVLDLVEGDRFVTDPNTLDEVDLPSSKIGEILIFAVKEKISLGLIIFASRTILPSDKVTVPETDFDMMGTKKSERTKKPERDFCF